MKPHRLLAVVAGTLLTACQDQQALAPSGADTPTATSESPSPVRSPTLSPSADLTALDRAKDEWQEAHFDFLDLYNQAPSGPGGLAAYVRQTERQLRIVERAFRRFEAEARDVLNAGGGPSGLPAFLSVMDRWLTNQQEQNEVFHRCGQDPQCIFVDNAAIFQEGQRLSQEATQLQQADSELSEFLAS
jgi:hypothetical protein